MSNATDTTGCISHRANSRFFIMYEDFQDIAFQASPEHENKLAAFWRVLETKTNDRLSTIPDIVEECKKKGVPMPEEHLWIEIPYSEMMHRSRKIYKESAFQLAAAESERLGFSKSRVLQRPINPDDPDSPKQDYKEYLFLVDVMQLALTDGTLPTPIEINSPLLKSYNQRKEAKKQKRAIEKNSPPLLKSIAPPIDFNTNKDIMKDKESVWSDPLSDLPPSPDTHTPENDSHGEKGISHDSSNPVHPDGNPAHPGRDRPRPVPDKRPDVAVPGTVPNARPAQSSAPPGRAAQSPAWVALLDDWDQVIGKSGRPKWVKDAAQDIITRYQGTIDEVKIVYDEIGRRGLNKTGKPTNLETVANHWQLLAEVRHGPHAPSSNGNGNGTVSGRQRLRAPADFELASAKGR